MFTKGLPKPTFEYLRKKLMGWKDWFMPMCQLIHDSTAGPPAAVYCVLHATATYYISQIFGGLIIKRWRKLRVRFGYECFDV
ncbi:hypothetical protein THAOC_25035 [Thalassiosira oceanica]|uniref:Uncharacterized protein n=1 Tax=Thalassiosira oceanica TaxID=159749 RepID=K0RSE4_THAOC|nr:hypothetical protein THAOC_25035 [Thalassiosira oceanica]|eukprot:EJK55249.1 hypothetical protein THAOC_25035 [Thalassiosira oceanica]